jgi:hypothetical protein
MDVHHIFSIVYQGYNAIFDTFNTWNNCIHQADIIGDEDIRCSEVSDGCVSTSVINT